MIDVNRERLLSLADAARRIPGRCGGRPVSRQTVWMWTKRGCRGVVLDAEFVGGDLKTSEEALERFKAALNKRRVKPKKKNNADEILRRYGINLTEQTDGGADQGADANGLPVGQVAQR